MDIQKTSPDISAENSPKTAHTAEAIATVRADVVARAAGYAAEYLAGVDERGVAPATAAVDALAELCGAVPEGSTDAAAVVEMLHRVGSPGTVASSGGRYFGFVVGGMVPAALGAGVLANAWNQNAGMQAQTPTAAILEATAVRWVAELLGLPEGTGGAVVTGTNVENVSYGLTICAERAALVTAVSQFGPEIRVDAVAITNLNQAASPPCGACRQVLAEFILPDAPVLFPVNDGMRTMPFHEVLPLSGEMRLK